MAYVLIHGGSFTGSCWQPIVPLLPEPVVAVDLPGRGTRPRALAGISIADFVDAVVDDIESRDLRDVVLVGHSMAGLTMPGVAERIPDRLRHLALPLATLTLVGIGGTARYVRGAMLDVVGAQFVTVARAKGLSALRVTLRHVLRNALIPSVTMIGLAFGDLLYGAVLTETVYAWPGMGNYVVQSITALDFPAIMGFTVVASTAYVLLNLLVDLTYMSLDPQIRGVH